jgi:FHS family L-fucose permease-like MFS transporter
VPVICFSYLTFFAWKVSQVLKKQGIDVSQIEAEAVH